MQRATNSLLASSGAAPWDALYHTLHLDQHSNANQSLRLFLVIDEDSELGGRRALPFKDYFFLPLPLISFLALHVVISCKFARRSLLTFPFFGMTLFLYFGIA